MKKIKDFLKSDNLFTVVFFSAFGFFLYAPYELYISNKDEVWFTLNMFWYIPILVFAVVVIILLCIGLAVKRLWGGKIYKFYIIFLFTLGICLWVQGNFLNVSAGKLNGELFNWYDIKPQMLRDGIVWGFILVVLLMLNKKKKELSDKIVRYISILFIGMQFLTLIYLLIGLKTLFNADYAGNKYLSNEGIYEVGGDGNVIVLLVDMFDDDYFKDILEKNPELTEGLDGFIYFNNNTGLYPTTSYSLIAMFTGEIYLNDTLKSKEWIEEKAKHRLWVDELTDEGYKIGLYTHGTNYIAERIKDMAVNYSDSEVYITDLTKFTTQLYRLAACKYLPNFFKRWVWMNGNEFDGLGNIYLDHNKAFRDGLVENGITVLEGEKQFKFIHIDGMHSPYDVDEDGNDIAYTYTEPLKHARGVLKIVNRYVNVLKESGIYDKTAIVIMADHGFYHDGTLTNPLWLVKPKNAHGSMLISNVPSSQKNFAATILDLSGIDNYSSYGVSDLDLDENDNSERYFYQFMGKEAKSNIGSDNIRLIEYLIPSDTNNMWDFTLTGREYTVEGDIIEHKKFCLTCIEGREWDTSDRTFKPTLVHEPTRDNPSAKYIDYSVYETLR